MKVYLCYQIYHDYIDQWDHVAKVVSNEQKAKEWVVEFEGTDQESRFYNEVEVE